MKNKKILALIAVIVVVAVVAVVAATMLKKDEAPAKLIMATNASFPPYEYVDGDKTVGIDSEIAYSICADLGYDLEIMDIDFDAIIPAVTSGKADFGMAGMTVTEERLQNVAFSTSYATGVQAIVVKSDSPITSYDDLAAEGAAYVIGVQLSTTGDIYASDEFGDDRVQQFPNGNEAVLALVNDKIDCVIIDNEPAKAYVAANEGLTILETAYAVEDYAACFAKDNTELVDKFNASLKKLTDDGTVASIVNKYIKAE